jgi:glyoxylase-like metal-dependent hydrolase (beta-lactamase superfamily II)
MRGWITYLTRVRSRLAVLLTLAVVLPGGSLWYFAGYHASPRTGRVLPLGRAPTRIVPGIYLLGGLWPSAAYAVETSEGLVLVDSGLQSDAGELKSELAVLGLDWKRIRAILLTHSHGDHVGGAESLRAATGAKVYAGEGDASILRAGQPRVAFFSVFSMPDMPHPTTVDVSLKGGETLTFGDIRIQCIATPGHTPGSTSFLLEQKGLRALFAGDVIIMLAGDENPRTELRKPLGTYSAYLCPRYRGSAKDSLASLRRLRALRVPDLVLPGHPASDVNPQNPCLSQTRWESLLDGGIHDMEVLLSRYEKDGAGFLDGIPKQLLPDLYYLGDFGGVAVYGFFASSQFFLVNAPGGPGLVEFVSTRLLQLGREPVAPTAVFLTSCGSEETGGLKELVEKWHSQVVASPTGLERLSEICPAGTVILSSQELPRKGWPAISSIPLAGRGVAQVAYQVAWAGKTVLFSGRIPLKINQQSAEALASDLVSGKGNVRDYFASLVKLQKLKPELWLPAVPFEGQNACLYEKHWDQTIDDNLHVVGFLRSRSEGN